MLRSLGCTPLFLALVVAGCANPADDKFKATATDPKPVESASVDVINPTGQPDSKSAAPAPVSAPSADALAIAPEGSKIDFTGSKVTGSHSGGFKNFSGTAELASDQTALKKFAVEIDMNSTWADNEKLTGHLKSPDFFDVSKHPKATFTSTEIKPGGEKGASHTITGNLTLHGVTKSISFPATVKVQDGGLELTSEFAINRRDFQIVYPGKPDDLIRDEVVLKINVKAPKKA